MLNNEFPPLGGGTGTVNQAILNNLIDSPELAIELITSSPENIYESETFSERITIYKVPVNRFNIHHASNKELILYAIRAFSYGYRKHRQRKYDMCLAWSAVPAGATAFGLKLISGLPYILRVSGPDIPGFEERYKNLYPVLKPLIRSIWKNAEIVIAKCSAEAEMIHEIDPNVGVTIIPNGVDTDQYIPGEPIPDEGPLKLLCVARLIKRKGQHHLIEAVKRITVQGIDITLDLVGSGDAEGEYRELVKVLQVEDQVKFQGYISREEIPVYYAQAHVFVLPSYNEGMSVATLEAMACGLPVIVSRTPGTEELVREGENGFTFEWGDIDLLTQHLLKLDSDRPLARQMALESRIQAHNFSWDSSSKKFDHLFFSQNISYPKSQQIKS
ncbi:MAG: glycosyltransferase family 4 protein [Anaerolineales bacterium]|nr:glycosyltransferase family 4 protein [Anaerolineales bacterium]